MPRPEVLDKIKEAEQEADEIVAEAEEDREQRIQEAREEAEEIRQQAHEEAEAAAEERVDGVVDYVTDLFEEAVHAQT